ncbi:putative MFS family arabinose efflux permease [Novosphingobium capsulatum]|uniref:MFS family arabinose efflux permease n=1 Tax=Novosphingobium capsulatum TaxID=13688 RepID=A0ABU1MKU6_9SPHN|nr:hypothetical protein [Novosphingobium capsulatum]MDR6510970.1 putative MFS family arabinose efflux permease [Novosphingobium capsulatum]
MATSVKRRQAWLLDPPSHRELAAVMAVGTFALVIAGIQPLLFGALVNEGRISAAGLGGAVTVEFLALASGVALASARLQPVHLRLRGLLAAMALIAANVMSMRHAAPLLYVDRGIAGFSAGVLLSIPSLLLARSRNPSKLGAVLMVLQGLVQVAFSALLPLTLMPAWGANGGFLALAGTSTLAAVFVLGVPNRLPAVADDQSDGEPAQKLPPAGALSLLGVVLVYAFVFGFFSYLGQIGTEAHLGSDLIGLVLAVTVAASIVGSLLTAAIAPKVSFFRIYGISVACNAALIVILFQLPGPIGFALCAVCFGVFWGLLMPYQLNFTAEVDPTRRATLLVPGAQALGASLGPLLCALSVTATDSRGALIVAGACLLGFLVIVMGLHARQRRLLSHPELFPST